MTRDTIDMTAGDTFEVDVPTADGETQRYCVEATSAEFAIIKLLERLVAETAEMNNVLHAFWINKGRAEIPLAARMAMDAVDARRRKEQP